MARKDEKHACSGGQFRTCWETPHTRPSVQEGLDPTIDPVGMYSGMTKRLARSDGQFTNVEHIKDNRD